MVNSSDCGEQWHKFREPGEHCGPWGLRGLYCGDIVNLEDWEFGGLWEQCIVKNLGIIGNLGIQLVYGYLGMLWILQSLGIVRTEGTGDCGDCDSTLFWNSSGLLRTLELRILVLRFFVNLC